MSIIGIDLGTTNCLAAYWDGREARLIPNALGETLTPSIVGVDAQGTICVGRVAQERMALQPGCCAASFKRYLGTKRSYRLGAEEFVAEELAAFLLRALKEDAEAYLDMTIEEAVISVPAYFNEIQRRAIQQAATLAGLKTRRLISEPTAAALAYGLQELAAGSRFLIFDLGGGTFDVSIVEKESRQLVVRAVAGDNYLGGEQFDECIGDLFLTRRGIGQESLNAKEAQALRIQAELCRKQLGLAETAWLNCRIGEMAALESISRDAFAEAAQPLLARLRLPIERALRDAQLRATELDSIVLVGGATQMPLIHAAVSRMFGRFPACSKNTQEAVAIGAALQAAMQERGEALAELRLRDVCPYTLGVEVANQMAEGCYEGGFFSPIIERNATIPISRVERFNTVRDNQCSLDVKIYQGESRHTKNNLFLGQLKVPILPEKAGRQAIDVRFTYDQNGLLEVEASAVASGVKSSILIEECPNSMSPEEIKQRLARLEALKIHPRDRQENRYVLEWGERLHEEMTGAQRREIAALLQEFEVALLRQDPKEIAEQCKKMRRRLTEMEKDRSVWE